MNSSLQSNSNKVWKVLPLVEAVEICDSLRKPVSSTEREKRIVNKSKAELFPYYGATGQVGFIDAYLTDGEYVLLGEDGAPFLDPFAAKAYVIDGKSWVNNHAHILRSKTSNRFLCYYLNSFNFKGYVSGSTRLKLTQAGMKKIPVPVPPLSEQERIVGILDEAFEKIDKIQHNAERNLANAKELFQQVLDEEMTPKEGWLSSELQNAVDKNCSLSYGIVQPGDEKSEGIPVVRPVDLGKRTIGSKGLKRISPDISQSYRRTLLKGEEILLCVRGETGIVSMASKELAGANVTRGIVPILFDKQKINQIFGYYLMMSPFVYLQIKKKTTGTALKQINIGDLRQIYVSYPNHQTQDKIVKILDKSSAVLESLDNNFQQIVSSSTELKQQLLAKAFNGEL